MIDLRIYEVWKSNHVAMYCMVIQIQVKSFISNKKSKWLAWHGDRQAGLKISEAANFHTPQSPEYVQNGAGEKNANQAVILSTFFVTLTWILTRLV